MRSDEATKLNISNHKTLRLVEDNSTQHSPELSIAVRDQSLLILLVVPEAVALPLLSFAST